MPCAVEKPGHSKLNLLSCDFVIEMNIEMNVIGVILFNQYMRRLIQNKR